MPDAVEKQRLANYRQAYSILDRLQEDAPPEREAAIDETLDELRRQIEELDPEDES